MYVCKGCHAGHECPAGRHERLYWAKCEMCGSEENCFDCMPGAKVRHEGPESRKWGIAAYLHTRRVRYKRGEEA